MWMEGLLKKTRQEAGEMKRVKPGLQARIFPTVRAAEMYCRKKWVQAHVGTQLPGPITQPGGIKINYSSSKFRFQSLTMCFGACIFALSIDAILIRIHNICKSYAFL